MFTVHDRLYAVTQNLIVELLDLGARTKILASNRRQPPVSALDTEHLGTPALFAGPDHSLRAYAASRIFAWNGTDWRMLCSAPQTPAPPVISDEGVLFTANGWNGPAGVWRLSSDSDRLELCLAEPPRNMGRASASPGHSLPPAWKMPSGLSFQGLPAASRGPDLFLLVDHAKSENLVDEAQHLVVGKRILPQDGYHAQMLCFASNYLAPQEVLLRFNAEDTSLPVSGDQRLAGRMAPHLGSAWLSFSASYVFFGKELLFALPSGGGDPKFKQPQEGVWMLPLEQLDAAIASQRQAQQQQQPTSQRALVTPPTERNK